MNDPLKHFISHDKKSHNNILCNDNDCNCPSCQKYPLPRIKTWWKNATTPGPDAYRPTISSSPPTPAQEALWQKKLNINRNINKGYREKNIRNTRQEELDKQYAIQLWLKENPRYKM
jgi:hypothetical protein